jgi:hypothetical protein
MASTPEWKVYDYDGTYQAACKDVAAAACLVSFYGDRATIRQGHVKVVWKEGVEFDGIASESYDLTHLRILGRIGAV